ncbi:hypothetical protein L5515_010140 [Caenorhabditis briggsae]|uniref:SET domain-containing protein n=1 Tax=Caenorhabditis briggsae TaxID=6238 RepID=A0AAE9ELC5_CAEBR|nr:hypothetical protein L5515_010140 [Caenorhabditis briggsae]
MCAPRKSLGTQNTKTRKIKIPKNHKCNYKFHKSLDDLKLKKVKVESCSSSCAKVCENALYHMECPSSCAGNCKNQNFKANDVSKVSVSHTVSKGFGLFAAFDIKKDDFVIAFTGDVISSNEYKMRILNYKKSKTFPYIYKSGPFYIDATERGNPAKYSNYACNFNMRTEKWQLDGKIEGFVALGFFAERRIKKGEELTIDYNFDEDE